MKWLNYHHLIYFREIATCGSISKASEKLLIGQPALSSQLSQFENSLGHKLFTRKNRKLFLTEAGHVALEYANQIYNLGQEFLHVMKEKGFTTKAHLQIGTLDSVPKYLIWKIIEKAQEIDKCLVSVLEGRGEELLRDLMDYKLDLILSNYPGESKVENELYSKSLIKVPVSIFGSKDFCHLRKNFPESLDQQPFIMPTNHSKLRHDLEYEFETKEIQFEMIAETQDTSVQKMLGIKGLGLVPLPDFAVDELAQEKKLFKIGTLERVFEEYWLISTKRMIKNPIAARLIEEMVL